MSASLLKIWSQIYTIRKIEVLALKLLFLKFFVEEKQARKFEWRENENRVKNVSKLNAIFIFLYAKVYKYFFIFLKSRLFEQNKVQWAHSYESVKSF